MKHIVSLLFALVLMNCASVRPVINSSPLNDPNLSITSSICILTREDPSGIRRALVHALAMRGCNLINEDYAPQENYQRGGLTEHPEGVTGELRSGTEITIPADYTIKIDATMISFRDIFGINKAIVTITENSTGRIVLSIDIKLPGQSILSPESTAEIIADEYIKTLNWSKKPLIKTKTNT